MHGRVSCSSAHYLEIHLLTTGSSVGWVRYASILLQSFLKLKPAFVLGTQVLPAPRGLVSGTRPSRKRYVRFI